MPHRRSTVAKSGIRRPATTRAAVPGLDAGQRCWNLTGEPLHVAHRVLEGTQARACVQGVKILPAARVTSQDRTYDDCIGIVVPLAMGNAEGRAPISYLG